MTEIAVHMGNINRGRVDGTIVQRTGEKKKEIPGCPEHQPG